MVSLFFSLVIWIFIFIKAFKVVNQSEVLIIERFGKYYRTAGKGLNIVLPFIDKVRTRVDLREQVLDIPPQSVITKDNVTIKTETVIFYQIQNAAKSVYEVENLTNGVKFLTQTTLRDIIGNMKLDDLLNSTSTLNIQLRKTLDEAVDKWGCKINSVEIKDINLPKDIQYEFERNISTSKNTSETYQYSTFFKQTIQAGDIVRVLKVDDSRITIEKID